MAISLISLAGLPPTAGFIGKFTLFWAVLQARYVIIAAIGILMAILSVYFYFRVVVALFMRPAERAVPVPPVALTDRFAGALILVLILLLGLIPTPVFTVIGLALPFLKTP